MAFEKGHKFYKGGEKGWFKKGFIPNNKGSAKKIKCLICGNEFKASVNDKYCSSKCYGISMKGKIRTKNILRGENHPCWIKDRTKLKKKNERNDPAYKEWSKEVKKRDGWKCKMCNNKKGLVSHHILPWRDYPELRYEVNNGITLCHDHHPKKRIDEERLISEFKKLIGSYEQNCLA